MLHSVRKPYQMGFEVGFDHAFLKGFPKGFPKGFQRPTKLFGHGSLTRPEKSWDDPGMRPGEQEKP